MVLGVLFLAMLIVAAVVAFGLAVFALRQGALPSIRFFALMLVGEAIWAAGYCFEILALTLEGKIFWDNVQFVGSDLLSVGALLFAVTYTRASSRPPRWAWLLAILPLLTIIVVWTDPLHGWLRPTAAIDQSGAFPALVYEYGPWFWVFTIYAVALSLSAIVIMTIFLVRGPRGQRVAAAAALFGLSAPFSGAIIATAGFVPIPGMANLDISPLTFTIANPLWAWAMLRGGLFKLVPVAYERLVELLPDGVIVADANRLVVTANAVARRLLGDSDGGMHGQPLSSLLPALASAEPDAEPLVLSLAASGGGPVTVEATLTLLHDEQAQPQGWLLMLRDITARHTAEQALREREALLRSISDNLPNGLIYQLERMADGTGRFRYISAGVEQLWGLTAEEVYADAEKIWSRIDPLDRPAFEAAARRSHEMLLPFDMELRVVLPDGTRRWTNSRSSAYPGEDGRLLRNGIEIDITTRKTIEEQLRIRINELVVLNEVAQALSAWTNLGEGLEAVSPLLLRIFSARTITVWEYDAPGRRLVPIQPQDGDRKPLLLAEGAPLASAVVERSATSFLSLPAAHPLFSGGNVPDPAGLHSILLIPLRSRNATIGLLCLSPSLPSESFGPHAIVLAQTVASLLASAVENARLFAAAEAAAAERERRAIARELHDSVSQALYAANVAAETIPLIWELDPEEGRERLVELHRFTRSALAEMRALLIELRPRALVDAALHETLQFLVAALAARGTTEVKTAFGATPLLPPDVQIALYRIAQEALNNVSKHARATRLCATLSLTPLFEGSLPWAGSVTLSVVDDGCGFDPAHVRAGRMGLEMMRERAEEIGASFSMNSRPGAGTAIAVSWCGADRGQG